MVARRWMLSLWFACLVAEGVVCAGQARMPFGPPFVTGQPYTAERVETSYQKLADGTTIQREQTIFEARDSQGRTWERRESGSAALRPGQPAVTFTSLYDPNLRTKLTWCSCNKVVRRLRFGEARFSSAKHGPGAEEMNVFIGPGAPSLSRSPAEELPSQVIEGVTTRGSKVLHVIRAGVRGNDRDLVTTIQSWYSPELQMALITITDNPMRGLSKMEIRHLRRIEPAATLFDLPEGYTVEDMGPH